MTDEELLRGAFDLVIEAEPAEYVTDPAEVAALIAASPFGVRRRRTLPRFGWSRLRPVTA